MYISLLVNVLVSKPEFLVEISKPVLVSVPRLAEVQFGRAEIVPSLNHLKQALA